MKTLELAVLMAKQAAITAADKAAEIAEAARIIAGHTTLGEQHALSSQSAVIAISEMSVKVVLDTDAVPDLIAKTQGSAESAGINAAAAAASSLIAWASNALTETQVVPAQEAVADALVEAVVVDEEVGLATANAALTAIDKTAVSADAQAIATDHAAALASKESANDDAVAATADASSSTSNASTISQKVSSVQTYVNTTDTQAGVATAQADLAAVREGIALAQRNIATTQAGIAATQAALATTKAAIATTQADQTTVPQGTAATQAGIAASAATAATGQVTTATTQAATATTQAVSATTAGASSTSKTDSANADALMTAVHRMQISAAVTAATNSRNVAAAAAITSAALALPDYTAYSGALHRSSTGIAALFLYDTSKDSDGGAWTEKCQNTSWYNETTCGQWLGVGIVDEYQARGKAAVPIQQLITGTNSDFSAGIGSWISDGGGSATASGNTLIVTAIGWTGVKLIISNTVIGQTYRISCKIKGSANGVGHISAEGIDGGIGGWYYGNTTTDYREFTEIWTASSTAIVIYVRGANSGTVYVKDMQLATTVVQSQAGAYYGDHYSGTFYKISKNFLSNTEDITSGSWSFGGASRTMNYGVAPDGTTTAHRLVFNGVNQALFQAIALHAVGTASVCIKGVAGETIMFQNNVTDAPSLKTLTGNWDLIQVAGPTNKAMQWLLGTYSGATARDVLIWHPQLEIGTVATAYESKANSIQVFRGNKKGFPRSCAFVLQDAGVNTLTIYDLTQKNCPMWMQFVMPGSLKFLNSGAFNHFAVTAAEGRVYVGGDWQTLLQLDFAKDDTRVGHTQAYYLSKRKIADRNVTPVLNSGGDGYVLPSVSVKSIALAVMSNAPVDVVTGLRIPTVALATDSYVCLIKNNGVILNLTSPGGPATRSINITEELLTCSSSNTASWYYLAYPEKLTGAANFSTLGMNSYPRFNTGSSSSVKRWKNTAVKFDLDRIGFLRHNQGDALRGLGNVVSNTYATGWMPGDTRRCYLADTVVGGVSGTELAINGNFDANTAGWFFFNDNSTAIDATVVAGALVYANLGGAVWPKLNSSTSFAPANKLVCLTIDVTAIQSADGSPYTALYCDFNNVAFRGVKEIMAPGVYDIYAYTGSTPSNLSIVFSHGDLTSITINSISVKEVVKDRSYKSSAIKAYGTLNTALTSPSASNQLVAYSGFSSTNYLREPYSSDLDFGTGEFNMGAWVKFTSGSLRANLIEYPEQLDNAAWVVENITVSPNHALAPDGTFTADKLIASATTTTHLIKQILNIAGGTGDNTFSFHVKAAECTGIVYQSTNGVSLGFNAITGQRTGGDNAVWSSVNVGNDWWYISITHALIGFNAQHMLYVANTASPGYGYTTAFLGDGSSGLYVWGVQLSPGAGSAYVPGRTARYTPAATVVSREYINGAMVSLFVDYRGYLQAIAYDGTTTRTVTTTGQYNTGTYLKAVANYRAGKLWIEVNGVEVASTNGTPLLTMNNSNAVLTIGNSYALDAPFPGSIALLKIGATVPTAEQSLFMYEQEKAMFRDNAMVTLPTSSTISNMVYDEATDCWCAVQPDYVSSWNGLVRTSALTPSAGTFSNVEARSGVKLLSRITTSPGVDITLPSITVRDEFLKRAELDAIQSDELMTFDFDAAGFTATTVSGSNAITSVSSVVGTPYLGMGITGTGIPTNTTIIGINGATYYLSANATANGSGVVIGQSTFLLPMGWKSVEVIAASSSKREGSTKDWERLSDGFRETVRFLVSPGSAAWVQITALREKQ